MDKCGAFELLMPTIQPSELWEETGRWADYGDLLLKIHDRHERLFCYGPTHEEIITDILRKEIKSYKQLPVNFYQTQTKFRDEIRPRFGVMRAREFLMKDAYSFHLDQASLESEYEKMAHTYENIFNQLDLDYRKVEATSGEIGGSVSHEFHVLAESGEDEIAFCDEENFAANIEAIEDKKIIYYAFIRSRLEQSASVWHISLTKENINGLERVQKNAVRIILKNEYNGYKNSLEKLDMETLYERRSNLCLNFAIKCTKNKRLSKMFPKNENVHQMIPRWQQKFKVQYANTERLRKCT